MNPKRKAKKRTTPNTKYRFMGWANEYKPGANIGPVHSTQKIAEHWGMGDPDYLRTVRVYVKE